MLRLDLHNHTIDYRHNRHLLQRDVQKLYLQIVKLRFIDGFAITNYHNIENALLLATEFPEHIIVGCEYRVFTDDNYLHIVALRLDEEKHRLLMDARLRGLEYFTSVLKEKKIPYFLVRIGWGIDCGQESVQLLESFFHYCDALEVINITTTQECRLAQKLADYYHLAGVGGSDYSIIGSGRKAYTQAEANDIEEFFQAFAEKKVTAGVLMEPELSSKPISIWQSTRNFYQKNMQNLWLEENIVENLNKNIILPVLHWIPEVAHMQKLKKYEKKILELEKLFVHYLKLQQTQKLFADEPTPEQNELWQQAMSKIDNSFG